MGKIVIKEETSVTTPVGTGKHTIYIDSADGKIKKKDSVGVIDQIASESYVPTVCYTKQEVDNKLPQFMPTALTHFEVSGAGSSSGPPYNRTTYSTVVSPTIDTEYLIHLNLYCSGNGVRGYAGIEYSTNNSTWLSMPYVQYSNTADNQTIIIPMTFMGINGLYYRGYAGGSYVGGGASIDLIRIK